MNPRTLHIGQEHTRRASDAEARVNAKLAAIENLNGLTFNHFHAVDLRRLGWRVRCRRCHSRNDGCVAKAREALSAGRQRLQQARSAGKAVVTLIQARGVLRKLLHAFGKEAARTSVRRQRRCIAQRRERNTCIAVRIGRSGRTARSTLGQQRHRFHQIDAEIDGEVLFRVRSRDRV